MSVSCSTTNVHVVSMIETIVFKGPLKYLVAKLHGCYPRAISLPVSQNIFARFSSAGPSPIHVAGDCFFTSLQHHKKNFAFTLLLINFLLYGYNT